MLSSLFLVDGQAGSERKNILKPCRAGANYGALRTSCLLFFIPSHGLIHLDIQLLSTHPHTTAIILDLILPRAPSIGGTATRRTEGGECGKGGSVRARGTTTTIRGQNGVIAFQGVKDSKSKWRLKKIKEMRRIMIAVRIQLEPNCAKPRASR